MPEVPVTCAVIGAGGVGGYFGAMLWRGGMAVRFLARGAHFAAMQQHGLRAVSPETTVTVPPAQIMSTPEAVGPADVVLVCVKSYDTIAASRLLPPLLGERTIVISLQNGMENEEQLQRLVPRAAVLGGVAYVYATITAPGVVTEHGGPRKIVFGPLAPLSPQQEASAAAFVEGGRRAGLEIERSSDIRGVLWKKFIFISAVGGLTALTRLTLGEILASPETRQVLAEAMQETITLARARGIVIEPGYLETTFATLARFENSTRSSLYHDLTHGRPLELEALSGAVVRIARELQIDVPIHRLIHACLVPYERMQAHSSQEHP